MCFTSTATSKTYPGTQIGSIVICAALTAATEALETEALEIAARDVAALTFAPVVVADTVAGEEDKPLADPLLEPETAELAGMDPETLIVPMDMEPLPVVEAKQEGAGVSSAL